ncbi:hypothetical protein BTR14_20610 [Rhizobium rhizosphaerae]|uniref:Uncharacterized protein n=1 Tax=Xaviernesmea rhizosphaerae TaxID=1672749 RepID=A0ABX3P7Z4_9HYPH|nr:hypothetical protein [Xaviernesmea rhizosphaerae]OQP84206.1 hypothetical protein BTR14_20610 [Xaviernesmea rhizosphaerae]
MASDKEKSQRRVYVLPTELVERIIAYQTEMGIASEVEAARRLLDEALRHREDWFAITRRFQERLKETKVMSDIAKEVLVGHPKVRSVKFASGGSIQFEVTTGDEVTIDPNGEALAIDARKNRVRLDKDGIDPDEIPF